ncbi:MotE family protein [Desulfovibrio sp. 86]|uniref:Magnesium transporter MgtE intracellular domain-containing protein n=1 Tax=uncultured Desulfovibrio sp. TaxID=167968 RepID=A0A212L8T9_9BACT|nr:MotE family protein [Desulfovibrio sp. 86]SCM73928.1 conserved hypothetical protein [uncultured Desulfovibrio sp.]VZH34531.1 conserved protein of unknown function [Desulfovibrio sp. 86]
MTKQPPSATKLRLSKLFRWLAVLCFIKLSMLCMLLLDVPLPTWLGGAPSQTAFVPPADPLSEAAVMDKLTALVAASRQENAKSAEPVDLPATPQRAAGASPAHVAPSAEQGGAPDAGRASQNSPADRLAKDQAHAPQGSAAAKMAAAAQPRGAAAGGRVLDAEALPSPMMPAGVSPISHAAEQKLFTPPDISQPAPLAAPLAQPGVSAPAQASPDATTTAASKTSGEHSWLDALGRLPIPALGSVQAAHAAAQDMPVPQTPPLGQTTPFAPAAQTAPYSLPGVPDIPSNIPRGQGTDGAPLPPRGASGFGDSNAGSVPSLPMSSQTGVPAPPTPTVRPPQTPTDPNIKAQELARQQQDILMLRQQMDQRLKDMQSAEEKMKGMIREARGIEDEKIRRLVLTYTQMKPKAAAKALESMDERVAVRILTGMSPKQSGDILTYVNPAKTAKLTEIITRMKLPE